jgi:hypothetical protein
MSVIFEGVDGIGKTTKALKLIGEEPMFRYIHNWAKPKTELNILSEITKELILLDSPIHLAIDRSYIISEFIYSTILNRPTSITIEHVKEFVDIVNKQEHIVNIMCYLNIDMLNIEPEDKDLPFEELNKMYMSLFTDKLTIDNLVIDVIDITRGANYEND